MRVEVYVEGESDVYAMKNLLAPLLRAKRGAGVNIKFFRARKGDAKSYLVSIAPVDAASTLPADPGVTMVVMPDLYPKDKPDKHETPEQLRALVVGNFKKALADRGRNCTSDLEDRFRVFCFKHDLEALLLAAPRQLGARLGNAGLKETWRRPVEDQNHAKPPKAVVQELFRKHKKSYDQTVDAPLILASADLSAITQACPQCFKPFVDFLESCGAAN